MRVGILGGGQLALMLLEAAAKLKIDCKIFVEDPNSPALKVASNATVGKFAIGDLKSFLNSVDLCLFESEFIDTDILKIAAENIDVKFAPCLESMALFQDKLLQKKFCSRFKIPTAPYITCEPGENIESFLEMVKKEFGKCVIKWARLGYDGKGNFVFDDNLKEATPFINTAHSRQSAVYAEKYIAFDKELAIIGCRSISGQFANYPVVISEQKNGICLTVKGPAERFGISQKVVHDTIEIAKTIGKHGELLGSYGVELFQLGEDVMVNEIAPRVHNTGHYTQDAGMISQFENHLRATIGMTLGSTDAKSIFCMRNILGNCISDSDLEPIPSENIILHWYGKKGIRVGRKLGHFNAVANDQEGIKVALEEMEKVENKWLQTIKK